MKKIFYIITIIFLFITCSQEPIPENFTIAPYTGDNVYATVFLKKFRERPQGEDELRLLLKNQKPLFEYTTTGQSERYGFYYMIPLQDVSSSTVNSALIYPVDFGKSERDRSYNGVLDCPPVVFDAEMLNQRLADTSRFLYSYHFLEWKEKGLKVQPDLTDFAEKLYGKEVPIECPEEFAPLTKAGYTEWEYDISIKYEVVGKRGIDEWGDACITQLHYEFADRAFKECMDIFIPSGPFTCMVLTLLPGI